MAEINYYYKLYLKKLIFASIFIFLVLLAMLLKYYTFEIHIPIDYLILNNLTSKEMISEQKMRVGNWMMHKHL